jgi:hypothetical protein
MATLYAQPVYPSNLPFHYLPDAVTTDEQPVSQLTQEECSPGSSFLRRQESTVMKFP